MADCYSYEDLKAVIDTQYNAFEDFNASCIQYIKNVDNDNFLDYKGVLEKQGKKGEFNLFETIYPKWRYENFHSRMLKFFLETNPTFFDAFLTLIDANKENYQSPIIDCETDRIDISIKGEKHVIIIENKLNWAVDQDNQIYKYYKKMKDEKKLEVEKIVYLSPSKYKEASENSLGFGKDEYSEITKNFIHLVGFDASDKDLVSCLEKTESASRTEDCRVFLNHYIEILKQTGVGDMSVIARKFLEEIQKNEDKDIGKKLAYIKEMLDNLPEARQDYWLEILKSEKDGIDIIKEYENTDVTYRIWITCNIFEDTRVSIFNDYSYELPDTEKENKKYQTKLKKILDNENVKVEPEQDNDCWYKDFKFPNEDDAALKFVKKVDEILSNL